MAETKPYIGKMDRRILIEKENFVRNETGELKPVHETVISCFAEMVENSGGEDVEGKVRHLIDRSYIIRYNANVLFERAKLKVTDSGITYNVHHVKEIGRKSHIKLLVTAYE